MTEQDEQVQNGAGAGTRPGACPRVRGLLYVDLLMIGGMPLLLVFELVRRLIWFAKKHSKRKPLPEDAADKETTPREKAFGLHGFTFACILIFMAEEVFIGLPYVFMMWQYMSHPNLEVALEILIFPCHATLHFLLFWPMFC